MAYLTTKSLQLKIVKPKESGDLKEGLAVCPLPFLWSKNCYSPVTYYAYLAIELYLHRIKQVSITNDINHSHFYV